MPFGPSGTGGGGASIGGAVTGGTAGSVLFINPAAILAQDNANLFWDDANNRLGIGNNIPAEPLDVTGNIAVSGNAAIGGFLTVGNDAKGALQVVPARDVARIISGYTYTNNAVDPVNDIDIAAGVAANSTDSYLIRLAGTLTKQSDVAWALGSNAGMLDAGVVGNNDYYLYAIARSDTGVVDIICSLADPTIGPALPANYDRFRAIGWFKRVAGTIVAFTTYETAGGGLEFLWNAPTLDINLANTLTTARRTDAVKVPLNFSVTARINVHINDAATVTVWIYCPDQSDQAPTGAAAPLADINSQVALSTILQLFVRTSAAGLIAARASTATVDVYRVSTIGFQWDRRN